MTALPLWFRPRGLRVSTDEPAEGTRDHRLMTSSPVLHVTPTALGKWHLLRIDDPRPLSEHDSATEAEREARKTGAREILVRDRYARVRTVRIEGR